MASIRLPISQPGTRCKCCFSHLVDHGQPSACWVWVHPLLITAIPVGRSRAAIPKCCRRGALEQQKFALWLPEARMVGWPCSVCSVGEPLPACPPPSGGDWQPSGFPGFTPVSGVTGHHPSLCMCLQHVSHPCESACGCMHTVRVKIACPEWTCPSGAGWRFWSPQWGSPDRKGGLGLPAALGEISSEFFSAFPRDLLRAHRSPARIPP